jgi:uncharacterized low-complexity protein
MSDHSNKYRTFSTIAALSLGLSGAALAEGADSDNPFEAEGLDRGFMAASAMPGDEGSCGEGSCGEGDGNDKDEEGSCGEGSCGEGSDDEQDDKDSEGACGEGTCGVA